MTRLSIKSSIIFEFSSFIIFIMISNMTSKNSSIVSNNDSNASYVSKYALNEYENEIKIMSSFSLNEKYVIFQDFLKIINFDVKAHDYSIYIFAFSINRKNVNDTIYLTCSRNEKIKKSKSKNKRNAKFKRIECSFQIVEKLIDNK